MGFLGRHADQPEGAWNLKGGRLGDRAGKPSPTEWDTGKRKLDTIDRSHRVVANMQVDRLVTSHSDTLRAGWTRDGASLTNTPTVCHALS